MSQVSKYLDIWVSAETPKKTGGRGGGTSSDKTPHGIQTLRELILELAVRGKLVSQNSKDELASVRTTRKFRINTVF